MFLKICKGAFINHVDMAGGGGLPNVSITKLHKPLKSKIVHKRGGGGGQKCPKICPHGP